MMWQSERQDEREKDINIYIYPSLSEGLLLPYINIYIEGRRTKGLVISSEH